MTEGRSMLRVSFSTTDYQTMQNMKNKISFIVNSITCINIYSKEAQTQFFKLYEVLTCPWALQQGPRVTGRFRDLKKNSILEAGLADLRV